jgi:hypothetical protein
VCLVLAWRIHGDAKQIKATAKRLTKRVHKRARPTLAMVIGSSNPPLLLELMFKDLDNDETTLPRSD